MDKKPKSLPSIETLKRDEATRKNIPTAEYHSVMAKEQQSPVAASTDTPRKWCVIGTCRKPTFCGGPLGPFTPSAFPYDVSIKIV
jgi:hypothetical protein